MPSVVDDRHTNFGDVEVAKTFELNGARMVKVQPIGSETGNAVRLDSYVAQHVDDETQVRDVTNIEAHLVP